MTRTGSSPNPTDTNRSKVNLSPATAPGRSNRKAREFAAAIAQLCVEGYGCKAIREALANAGLNVSKSTVQREIARLSRPDHRGVLQPPASPVHRPLELDSPAASTTPLHRPADRPVRGKAIAEAFFEGRITNPLYRNKDHR